MRIRASATAAGDGGTGGRWARSAASDGTVADDRVGGAAGERSRAIDQHLSYSLQFTRISSEQLSAPSETDLPASVRAYIARFDSKLTVDELNSDRFAVRMLFVPSSSGRRGRPDEVIEFLRPDSEIAQAVNRDYVAFKRGGATQVPR